MKINQRLFDHYGINTNKDLAINDTCARPFDTILIDRNGSCFACECQAWLPQSIGNLRLMSLEQIIGSKMHEHLRRSVLDGTYKYCNEHRCSYLRSGYVDAVRSREVKNIRLAIDDSCNLRCPSCRTSMIFHKNGPAYDTAMKLADSVNDWLGVNDRDVKVHLGSDGDPFASHVYRHFMSNTPLKDNIKYSLLTNALMLPEFHSKVPGIMSRCSDLGMSIDGASQDTYESLRLGGKWHKAKEALAFIGNLRQNSEFYFSMHMVVQQDNWHEIREMLSMAKLYNADRLYLNRIEDWNTGIDFQTQTFIHTRQFRELLAEVSSDPLIHNNVISF